MRRGRRLATGRPEAARVGLLAPEIAVKSWPPRTRRSQGAMLVPASGWLLSAPAGEPAPAPRRPARRGSPRPAPDEASSLAVRPRGRARVAAPEHAARRAPGGSRAPWALELPRSARGPAVGQLSWK